MTMNHMVLRFGMAVGLALSIAQTNAIKLGASVQLSGSLVNTGRYYRDAYNLALNEINDKGGVAVGEQRYMLTLDLLSTTSRTSI